MGKTPLVAYPDAFGIFAGGDFGSFCRILAPCSNSLPAILKHEGILAKMESFG